MQSMARYRALHIIIWFSSCSLPRPATYPLPGLPGRGHVRTQLDHPLVPRRGAPAGRLCRYGSLHSARRSLLELTHRVFYAVVPFSGKPEVLFEWDSECEAFAWTAAGEPIQVGTQQDQRHHQGE